jgi:glutamine amidotransferase
MRIGIVDYGVGNLKSISMAVKRFNAHPLISSGLKDLETCDGIILPGVGAFKCAISNLAPMQDAIMDWVNSKPIMGICLGMQLYATESEEGGLFKGLNIISGRVVRIQGDVKIPHMGWNNLKIRQYHEILDGVEDNTYMYFVHSYYMETEGKEIITLTEYGKEFPSIIARKNVVGVQFHPEKSGESGLRIVENFLNMCRK